MENYKKLVELVANMQSDAEKTFEKQNQSAAKRFRKSLKEVKDLLKVLKDESLKTKEGE